MDGGRHRHDRGVAGFAEIRGDPQILRFLRFHDLNVPVAELLEVRRTHKRVDGKRHEPTKFLGDHVRPDLGAELGVFVTLLQQQLIFLQRQPAPNALVEADHRHNRSMADRPLALRLFQRLADQRQDNLDR